jgi:hypothetical protein
MDKPEMKFSAISSDQANGLVKRAQTGDEEAAAVCRVLAQRCRDVECVTCEDEFTRRNAGISRRMPSSSACASSPSALGVVCREDYAAPSLRVVACQHNRDGGGVCAF